MQVTYQAIGRCPRCRSAVVVFDIDEPIPAHRGTGKAPCDYRGIAEAVRRVPLKEKPKKKQAPQPRKATGVAKNSAKTTTPPKKLSKKQKKRARAAQVAKVIREGNKRLYGDLYEPRSPSVKTVSGGLPTLGK